jgi:hypothetical protein
LLAPVVSVGLVVIGFLLFVMRKSEWIGKGMVYVGLGLLVFSLLFVPWVREARSDFERWYVPSSVGEVELVVEVYEEDGLVVAEAFIENVQQSINAVRLDLVFPAGYELEEVIDDSDFVEAYITKSLSKGRLLRVEGGLPNPGFEGDRARFVKLIFTGDNDLGGFKVISSSVVLANDGKASNLLDQRVVRVEGGVLPGGVTNTGVAFSSGLEVFGLRHDVYGKRLVSMLVRVFVDLSGQVLQFYEPLYLN